MRVFSATTPRRTARSRTASSSGATRRLWRWLRPSSSRGECLLSSGERWWRRLSTSSTARPPRLSTAGRHTRLGMGASRRSLTYGSSAASRSARSLATSASSTTGALQGCSLATRRARRPTTFLTQGQRVRTTRDVVFDEGRGWAWDKEVDDGSTPTYDNFTVEYVHFEGAGEVGSSLPLGMSTPVLEPPPTSALRCPATTSAAMRSSPPPPQSEPPCTPAATATPSGTSTPTPARVENSMEFATPLPHDEECIDAYHDGEPLRCRTMENLLGDQPVPGPVPHDLEAQLHLACDDGEPRSFAEAERRGMTCRDAVGDGRS
jgi:hypothetical protein